MKIKLIIACCFVFNTFAMNQKIKMPSAPVLRNRLATLDSYCRSSINPEQLLNDLAGKEMEPIEIAQAIKAALAPYHKRMGNSYRLNYDKEQAYLTIASKEIDTKNSIYEVVFRDHPEALATLKANGQTDIPEETELKK